MGKGNLMVLLESGSGNFSVDWLPIQAEIAKFAKVCAYDRAGHGWSTASANPRSIPQIAQELHELLLCINQQEPIILVGHSLGGLYAQYFARKFPNYVAGMVLLDSSHPDLYPLMSKQALRANHYRLLKMWLAARFGLLQTKIMVPPDVPAQFTPDTRRLLAKFWSHPKFWWTMIDQNRYLNERVPAVFADSGPFPDIPLIILTPPGAAWAAALGAELPAAWLAHQEKLAQLSPHGKLIYAEQSGHMNHYDQPTLVIEAIREIVEQL